MNSENIYFILCRTFDSGNIGSALRALKNFNFGKNLRAAAPLNYDIDRIKKMSAGASDYLEHIQRFDSLEDSINDIEFIVSTTGRSRKNFRISDFSSVIEEISRISINNRVGILFGNETNGLSNSEISYSQRVISIPVSSEYSSINLSQAVMLTAYEIFRTGFKESRNENGKERFYHKLASHSQRERLFSEFVSFLKSCRILKEVSAERTIHYWRLAMERYLLTSEDAENLFSLIKMTERIINKSND